MKILEKSEKKRDFTIVTNILFAIYLVALTWAILFKFKINIMELHNPESNRTLLLKPFFFKEGNLIKPDFYSNVAAFFPYGIYFCGVKHDWNVFVKICIILMTSLLYESIQYAFAIGCADINDLISNTLGGIIGILIYYILYIIFKKHTNTVINIIVGLGTAFGAVFLITAAVNGSCEEFQNRLMTFFNF